MNKFTKAGIATAAAVALLMGGGGTLAYWNSTATLTSGAIAAGTLTVSASTGTWTNQNGDTISIGSYRIVPGDVLNFSADISVVAVGDTLEADLTLASNSIEAATTGDTAANAALAGLLTKTVEFDVASLPDGVTIDSGVLKFVTADSATPGTITATIPVTATITFPDGDTVADNPAKSGAVNLTNFGVALTQTF